MRTLIIFPPQWLPLNPHLAPAAINSILAHNGHKSHLMDLNIEFYCTILTREFLTRSLEKAFDDFNRNAGATFSRVQPGSNLKDYPREIQWAFQRYREILKVHKEGKYRRILDNIEQAVETFRNKQDYYNLELMEHSVEIITTATEILSSLYYPSKVNFLTPVATSYTDVGLLKATCLYRDGNIFHAFYESIMPRLEQLKPDYIGISLGDYTQLIPGLTLSMLLKSHIGAHINIGGNLFGRYTDILINEPEFFRLFADSIICNEGEKPVIQLLRRLQGEIPIEETPNLIYGKGQSVRINDSEEPYGINDLFTPDFSGMPIDKYFTPDIIFNLQASRDCYWRKCSFCTHFFGSQYSVKRVDRLLQEVKDLIKRYGQRYFHFIDEAMGPAYLAGLSEEIIRQGLDIDFYIYARMEKEFTPALLRKARQAGLRLILWGFESANERIYGLMNKGNLTSKEGRHAILQDAFNAGIWNYLFVMFGFPSETEEEARETAEFLYENRHIASFSRGGRFVLLDKAAILNDLPKYSISKVQKIRSGFSYAHRYETTSGMTSNEIREFLKTRDDILHFSEYKFHNSWSREKLFLYICKYGIEKISRMRDEVWI